MTTDVAALVSDNLDLWTGAIERKSGAGRGGGRKVSLYGIERLRALILDLAVRGRLVSQDPSDEPAAALLPRMTAERQRRVKAGEIRNAKGPTIPSSLPYDLPPGWVWLTLWQTGNIFTGDSINEALRAELEANKDGKPFVATKDVGYGLDPIEYENGLRVSEGDQRFSIARSNSVFICAEGGSAGRKIAISDREIAFGNKLIANETWAGILPRYVLYTYLSGVFFDCFSREMTGIIGGISRAKFLALPFPLPPLAEQQRIVTKVDELMVLCDALESQSALALEAHQTLVETLLATLVNATDSADLARQWARLETHFDILFTTEASVEALKRNIVDLAVRGKLVAQNDEDEPAKDLLQRIQAERSKIRGSKKSTKAPGTVSGASSLPPGWAWTPLACLGFTMTGGTPKSSQAANFEGSIPFIGPGQISPAGDILPAEKFLSEAGICQSTEAMPGDILMVCIGGSIGKTASAVERVAYNQQINAIRPVLVDFRFLEFCLRGSRFQSEVLIRATGSATPIINRSKWESILVPLPPLAEQQRIVVKVGELMALCLALQACLTDASRMQRQLAEAIVERAAA